MFDNIPKPYMSDVVFYYIVAFILFVIVNTPVLVLVIPKVLKSVLEGCMTGTLLANTIYFAYLVKRYMKGTS